MSVEQRIVVTVTRADMFLTSHWPLLLVAVILLICGIFPFFDTFSADFLIYHNLIALSMDPAYLCGILPGALTDALTPA